MIPGMIDTAMGLNMGKRIDPRLNKSFESSQPLEDPEMERLRIACNSGDQDACRKLQMMKSGYHGGMGGGSSTRPEGGGEHKPTYQEKARAYFDKRTDMWRNAPRTSFT